VATREAILPPRAAALGGLDMAVTGYCLKCKKQVEIQGAEQVTMKNGRPATTGSCPVCGTKIYKIGKAG
jgi:hypothetical protein